MRNVLLCLLAVACLGLAGCASKHMQSAAPPPQDAPLPEDKAAVVFFRSSSLGYAIQAPIIEATEGGIEYIAIISSGSKFLHLTTPGLHRYVAGGENSNLLEANLESGMYYYVDIEPRVGWWKARFGFVPIPPKSLEEEGGTKKLDRCDWVVNGPSSDAWFRDNHASLLEKRDNALAKGAEGNRDVLLPGYGVKKLYK